VKFFLLVFGHGSGSSNRTDGHHNHRLPCHDFVVKESFSYRPLYRRLPANKDRHLIKVVADARHSRIYFALLCKILSLLLFLAKIISDRHLSLSLSHSKLAMELFLELLLTIALSLSLSLVLGLLLSLVSAGKIKRASTVRSRRDSTKKWVTPQPKLEVEPKSRGCETERVIGFVEKADEYKTEPVRGFVSEGCESPTKDVGEGKVVELGVKPIGEISVENLVDGNRKREKVCEIEFDKDGDVGVGDRLFDLEDDWEGIERTELEKVFGAAVAFVGSSYNAGLVSSIGSDAKMRMYGLHKIATQGPCREAQPMAFKLSSRAKW
jgi:hypothetical protein